MSNFNQAAFADVLNRAIIEPGIVSKAYSAFHGYSIGNQLLALVQCSERRLQPGPIATYQRWRELGRQVRRGEKAIVLCQPVTVKRHVEQDDDNEQAEVFTRFIYRPHWFVLSQTDGQPMAPMAIATWDRTKALTALNITEEPFDMLDGNVQGFARQRSISVSPVAAMKHKTTFHELAHVLLGHTSEGEQADREITPQNLRECEAEAVALLCCAAFNLPGFDCCRGYIQAWWGAGNPIPERSAQRIFKAADQILKAGVVSQDSEAVA